MAGDYSRNSGIQGTIVNWPGSTTTVYAEINKSNTAHDVSQLDVTGPGDGGDKRSYLGYSGGSGSLSGWVFHDKTPFPKNTVGEKVRFALTSGTIIESITSACNATYPALLTNVSFGRAPDNENKRVRFSCQCVRNGPMTIGGYTMSAVNLSSAITYKVVNTNTSITVDRTGLDDRSQWREVIQGVPDTFAAEQAVIKSRVSALAFDPRTSALKLNTGTATRWADNIIIADYVGARMTSVERIEIPGSFTSTDPNNINSSQKKTKVDSLPTLDSPYKTRTVTVNEAVPGRTVYTVEGGLRSTKDDIQMPETFVNYDPKGNDSAARQAMVYVASGAAPSAPTITASGMKVVSFGDTSINDLEKKRTFELAVWDTGDKASKTKNFVSVDPHGIETEATTATFSKGGSMPAVPYGQKLVDTETIELPGGIVTVNKYGVWDSKDRLVFSKNMVNVDPTGLKSYATSALFTSSGNMPSVPAPLKIVSVETIQAPNGTLRVNKYGLNTAADEEKYRAIISTRSISQPWHDRIAAIVSSTTSASGIANSDFASALGTAYLDGVSVQKLDDNHALITEDYINPGITMQGSTQYYPRTILAKLDGSIVKAYVRKVRTRGSSYRLEVVPSTTMQYYRRFAIVRRKGPITSSISSPAIPDYASIQGQTNSAPFLGYPTGTVMYVGAEYASNIGISSQYPNMVYIFIQDPVGYFELQGFDTDVIVSSLTGITANAWNDVTKLNMTYTVAPQTSFDGFLS